MPTITINGAEIYYEDTGQGEETIVFSHGLLWSGRMFQAQVAALQGRYRCITYDHRGQGRSEVTAGGYDMDSLAEDAAALIEALELGPCHFAGLSMGGFVAMRLAARRPELLRSLILLETSADAEPAENVPRYRLLNLIVRLFGVRAVAGQVLPIMFGSSFLGDASRAQELERWQQELLGNQRSIVRAVKGVIDRAPIYPELDQVRLPTLIIVGDEDVATVPAKAQRIAQAIAGSRLVVIPGAGHTSTVEEPAAVNAALQDFLSALGSS